MHVKNKFRGAIFNEVKMLNLKETIPGTGNSTIQIEYVRKGFKESFMRYCLSEIEFLAKYQ